MAEKRKPNPSTNKNISINGDVKDSIVSIGDNNIFQKIINYIFPSEKETLEQRNRRILLGHVENAWIKGVLDASLHGAALLDLGIKPDPEAVTKYPWAIKKESTDETLPARTSMLEIFDSVGMGRSLLILGAPGSGKTTMLLELARQLIARAREDVTYPIPMVFNLASWTEKLSLADWLAQELNNLYSVPRKTAPDWVKGNKLLLLLDGLDEVRQESRVKCVEAINEFRKQNGLTSLAVCSRSQDYTDIEAKLSFEGAIEVQPLTQKQITEFFNRFGDEMAGIKQVLKKDSALREMTETPLFLSIMIMAYRDKRDVEILVSGDEKARRKHLFDTYIERMFERARAHNDRFKKQDVLQWLSWLARKIIEYNQALYLLENMQPKWLDNKKLILSHRLIVGVLSGLIVGLIGGMGVGLSGGLSSGVDFRSTDTLNWSRQGAGQGLIVWLIAGLGIGLISGLIIGLSNSQEISTADTLTWSWQRAKKGFTNWMTKGLVISLIIGLIAGSLLGLIDGLSTGLSFGLTFGLIFLVLFFLVGGPIGGVVYGLRGDQIEVTAKPGEKIIRSVKNAFFTFLSVGLSVMLIFELFFGIIVVLIFGVDVVLFFIFSVGLSVGIMLGVIFGLQNGGIAVIQHYTLRLILARNNLLPWRLVPFLDHCVDLIFLRRVGGGYIFVHRLLMEHFAEMYVETPTSKGN